MNAQSTQSTPTSRDANPTDTAAQASLLTPDVLAWLDTFADPTMALLDLARHLGVAVNYQSRESIEERLGRPLTASEWQRLRPEMSEDYDEAIDDTDGVSETVEEWLADAFTAAGLLVECYECGHRVFTADDGSLHHLAGRGDVLILDIDHATDARHTPTDQALAA